MTTEREWARLPEDPDLEDDLGYAPLDWDVVRPSNGSGHYVFLPKEEDMLRRDAFIVADEAAVCDVETRV